MAIVYTFSSQAALTGAVKFNRVHRIAAQEDVGFKLERAISTMNAMNSSISVLNTWVSQITSALANMIACAASFASALSTGSLSSAMGSNTSTVTISLATLSNFSDA